MIVFLFQLCLFGVIAILALDVFYIMNDLEGGIPNNLTPPG